MASRGHLRERLVSNVTGLPLANAVVTVRLPGTTTATSVTLYKALTGTGAGTFWTNPITTGADGGIDFYVDVPDDFDLRVVAAGYPDATIASVKAAYAQTDLVDKTSAQTLTNKTLTSPTLNSPTINSPVFSPAYEPRNFTIKNLAGSSDVARFRDGIIYTPVPLQMGTDMGWTADPVHLLYINKTVTGAWSQTTNIVDTLLVEVNGQTSNDADIGAVAGFARALATSAVVSMRGLAGQMMIDLGSQAADREAAELGVHNAKLITSMADNRTSFTKMFGAVGALISAYSGTQADGNPAQRANTAIAINTFGGVGGHWKQFLVAYTGANTKAIQIDDQGNIVAGGGGNNAASGAYGFLDTNGDVDAGTSMFWGGNDVIAFSINSTEAVRIDSARNVGVGGTAPSGSRLYVSGGLVEAAGGVKNSGVDIGALSIPTALAANTNNYVPSTGNGFAVYQISASGAVNLTGLNLSQTVAGHRVTLINGGGNIITLTQADAASSAANQFNTHTGANHALGAGKAVSLIFTGAAWRFYAVT